MKNSKRVRPAVFLGLRKALFDIRRSESDAEGNSDDSNASRRKRASIFADSQKHLNQFLDAVHYKNADGALEQLACMRADDALLTPGALRKMSASLCDLILDVAKASSWSEEKYVGPVLAAYFETLLDNQVKISAETTKRVGMSLFRWYDQMGEYESAADVVGKLLKVVNKSVAPMDHAILLNNLGYAKMLASDFDGAAICFDDAIKGFKNIDALNEQENSALNRFWCRVETAKLNELHMLRFQLSKEASEHDAFGHKYHFIECRIFERMLRIDKAIGCCQRAIDAASDTPNPSNYCERYKKHLETLLIRKRKHEKAI